MHHVLECYTFALQYVLLSTAAAQLYARCSLVILLVSQSLLVCYVVNRFCLGPIQLELFDICPDETRLNQIRYVKTPAITQLSQSVPRTIFFPHSGTNKSIGYRRQLLQRV